MEAVVEVESKRPKDTPFRQQRLKACQPILTPLVVICVFLGVGLLMFTLGFIMWHYNNQVVEVVVRYDNQCADPGVSPYSQTNLCNVTFSVAKAIPAPAFFYYRLSNFYQNHRRYVSSRNDLQLAGQPPQTLGGLGECTPIISVNGSSQPALFYNPCGLIANSWFLDSFPALFDGTGPVFWERTGISWASDRAAKFKPISPSYLAQYPNATGTPPPGLAAFLPPGPFPVTNEDFIVWMRVAGLPTFRKLYAMLPNGLPVGTYTVQINNLYSTSRFGSGTKSVVISSTSFIGGSNPFLGYAFIAVGSLCLLLALVFFIINLVKPRALGDPALLSWNRG